MSTNDPAAGPGPGQPEYLGTAEADGDADPGTPLAGTGGTGPHRGRAGLLAATSLAVLAAVGAGGWAVAQLMSTGTAPTTALPAGTVAFVSLDLDPSASQKIEALRTLRKFPALEAQLGGAGDVRTALVDRIESSGGCPGVDYARDVKPWLGDRVAVAGVRTSPGAAVQPVVAIQVTDQEAARAGARTLAHCAATTTGAAAGGYGLTFEGDYLLLTERQAVADAVAADAATGSLADDGTYQAWMDRVGDPGIVTMYAAPDAADAVRDGLRARSPQLMGGPSTLGSFSRLARGFHGAAGVVRFHDGAVELEVVSGHAKAPTLTAGGQAGAQAAALPDSTAFALSFGVPPGSTKQMARQLSRNLGGVTGMRPRAMTRTIERQTGLRLPRDLVRLLGDGVSVAIDGDLNATAFTRSPDPARLPAGIRIAGDPTTIEPVLAKLRRAAGPAGRQVRVRSGDDAVAVSLNRSYADRLLTGGGLGSTLAFADAVAEPDRASSVLFVNFDAGNGWIQRLADLAPDHDPEVAANLAPLSALGVSGWTDGDGTTHAVMRVTTQ